MSELAASTEENDNIMERNLYHTNRKLQEDLKATKELVRKLQEQLEQQLEQQTDKCEKVNHKLKNKESELSIALKRLIEYEEEIESLRDMVTRQTIEKKISDHDNQELQTILSDLKQSNNKDILTAYTQPSDESFTGPPENMGKCHFYSKSSPPFFLR